MNVTDIPFVKYLKINKDEEGYLNLPFNLEMQNHLQTVHASAQFALAETASGDYLQVVFPELADKVIPLLRDSHVKFKRPATTSVKAIPAIEDDTIDTFRSQFEKKGRAVIAVDVKVQDEAGTVTCLGTYNWFITK